MKDIKIVTGCVAVLTVIAVGFVLQATQGVFIPLFIAWILSYMMAPGVRFMSRLKVPSMLTTFVLMALLLYAVGQGGRLVSQILVGQADKYVEYYEQLREIWNHLSAKYPVLSAGFDLNSVNWGGTLRSYIISYSGSVINILSKAVMVVVFLLFILLGSPYVEVKMRKAFPQKSAQVMTILDSISGQIARFITVMTLISGATGLLVWAGLEKIGVDFAPTWGVLAFFLNFIPTVGSIIASIPPILVAIVQFQPDASAAMLGVAPQVLWTVGWILAVQQTIGNIITPKVMGDSMNLSPVIILISLLMWGWLWGVAGALLSMPIAGILKIVCDNVEPLQMVGVLMGSGKSYVEKESEAK
ncbi:MAG: AI-2E family transporter [Pyramidobacter sp.]|nr:AI-2E family transporter [Pyramidobacter sp.]